MDINKPLNKSRTTVDLLKKKENLLSKVNENKEKENNFLKENINRKFFEAIPEINTKIDEKFFLSYLDDIQKSAKHYFA